MAYSDTGNKAPVPSDAKTEETNSASKNTDYERLVADFVADVRGKFNSLKSEIAERNGSITQLDDYIYSDRLERSLNVPIGHDFTPVNWLRRTVEVHSNMFMGRGFQVVSTYDSQDSANASDQSDRSRIEVENNKNKEFAESRINLIQAIIRDNGGDALWRALAESASAVGDACVKTYYNEDEDRLEICPIESIENVYALWSSDNFREVDAYAYVYQVSKQDAINEYGAPEDVATSPLGAPMEVLSATGTANHYTGQPMVTILEVTGKMEGWGSDKGKLKKVPVGQETEFNGLIIGNGLTRLIDVKKKLPHYYIFTNRRQRRRPWGKSDISDAAVSINLTYIETLSDWRTLASKVNFQKYKAYGFGADVQMPKPAPRQVEYLPLVEGQDIVPLLAGDANGIDWQRQLDECKEQFVRETGISRVLFDDPSVTLNSNQALLTSMRSTTDIAEAKKQLWSPILVDLFTDALETVAEWQPAVKDLVGEDDNWNLKVMWPSVMQKEDPIYQNMLLNRFNAGLMSVQSYMEAQGDSKEEIDRLRDEINDPVTVGILGKQLPLLAQTIIQASTAAIQQQLMAAFPELFQQQGQEGSATQQVPGVNPNGGVASVTPQGSPADIAGSAPVSQPGTGATSTSAQGALTQVAQNQGA